MKVHASQSGTAESGYRTWVISGEVMEKSSSASAPVISFFVMYATAVGNLANLVS